VLSSAIGAVFAKQVVHAITHAITEVVTDIAHYVQPNMQFRLARFRSRTDSHQRRLEHAQQPTTAFTASV